MNQRNVLVMFLSTLNLQKNPTKMLTKRQLSLLVLPIDETSNLRATIFKKRNNKKLNATEIILGKS